jgi:hypothetical protein
MGHHPLTRGRGNMPEAEGQGVIDQLTKESISKQGDRVRGRRLRRNPVINRYHVIKVCKRTVSQEQGG